MADFWLVDSSAWIFALRLRPFVPIKQRIDKLLAEKHVLLTGMIELELLSGTRTEKDFSDLKELLEGLHRVATREADWQSAACMAFELRRKGYTVPFTDALIAQLAQRAGAGIVHADHDFLGLCRHFGIEQEDYSAAAGGGDNGGAR